MGDIFDYDSPEFKAWLDEWIPDNAPVEGEVRGARILANEQHAEPQELQEPYPFSGHRFTELGNFSASLGWLPADYPTAQNIGVPVHDHHYTSATVPRIHIGDQSTRTNGLPNVRPVATPYPPFDALETGAPAATIDIDPRRTITSSTDLGTPAAGIVAQRNEHGDPSIALAYDNNGGIDPGITTRPSGEDQMAPFPTSSRSSSSATPMEGFSQPLPLPARATLSFPSRRASRKTREPFVKKGRKSVEGFQCTELGCRSKAVFSRIYDLQRHIDSVHKKKTRFPCPVIDCYKKGSESLTRPDKFREHMRVSHCYDDLSECPGQSCPAVQPLLVLQLHVQFHEREKYRLMNAIANYMKVKGRERNCPIDGCHDSLPAPALNRHLGSKHSYEEREVNRAAVNQAGFDHESCGIICPICRSILASSADFRQHAIEIHMIRDYSHFKAMRTFVYQFIGNASKRESERQRWGSHEADIVPNKLPVFTVFNEDRARFEGAECPECSAKIFYVDARRYLSGAFRTTVIHEADYLQPADSLFERRLEMLKVFPKFSEHPVFAPDWPVEHTSRKETIEKHFSPEWIKNHFDLVYGEEAGTGSNSAEQDTADNTA